ncbi:hypothetical protein EVA_05441, partial [gut metagenome]
EKKEKKETIKCQRTSVKKD